jgi:hypothetical protein
MKKAVFEDLIDGGHKALPCQQFGIGDGFALEIFQFRALDEFHHQQVLRAIRFINLRNIDIGRFARIYARNFHVACFTSKIELAEQGFFNQANEIGKVETVEFFDALVKLFRQDGQDVQIGAHLGPNARTLDFDRCDTPIRRQNAAMDLGDRSRRHRRHIENAERLLERLAGALLNHRADLRHVHGRHVILKFAQFGNQRRRHQVRPQTRHLPELDKGRSQPFAGVSNSFKGVQRMVDGTFFPHERGPRNVETIDQIVKSVSEQDHDDIFETTQTR